MIAISDAAATYRIVDAVKRINKSLYVIVRTRYLEELETLRHLGADEIIAEEVETSIEISARVLNKYYLPRDIIKICIDEIRTQNYSTLKSATR